MDSAIETLNFVLKEGLAGEIIQVISYSHFFEQLADRVQECVFPQVVIFLRRAQLQALPQSVGKLVSSRVILVGLRFLTGKIEEAAEGRLGM